MNWDSDGDTMWCVYRGLYLSFDGGTFHLSDSEHEEELVSGMQQGHTDNEMVEFLTKIADAFADFRAQGDGGGPT